MAMYPPPQTYSQYPAQHIPHQPPVTYGYGGNPSRSYYVLDPESFRRDYTARLTELTVNSRPIIQGLSLYAQEYARWADTVVECIEAHIHRVPPWMKLPAFYLVDAISKNVFTPYAQHFASVVAPLFLETYNQVDQTTRGKMEEMLLTWRTGAPGGRELFGVGPQVAIERGIWGSQTASHGPGAISKQQVLSELEFALGQKERLLQSSPHDTSAQSSIGILQQLRKLVEAGVSQHELAQILNQLRSLSRPVAPSVSHSNISAPPQFPSQAYSYSGPSSAHQSNFNNVDSLASIPTTVPVVTPIVAAPSSSASVAVPDVSSLFQSLVKSGILSNTGTPTGAGATAKAETPDRESKGSTSSDEEDRRAYRAALLSESIGFNSAEISRHRPRISGLLYDRLNLQCGQCGVRFLDSTSGKKKMQDHLDEHFRANRKANQNAGRGHSRCWFVTLDEWLSDNSTMRKGKSRSAVRLVGRAATAIDEGRRLASLRAQCVVVPTGEEAKPIVCSICKETLKAEFNEDDEEWVWKNATNVDGQIYHATCHADAMSSVSTLASRLLTGRPSTPDVTQSQTLVLQGISKKSKSPSPIPGLKRKADADLNPRISHMDMTPPSKKAMLSHQT